MTSKKSRMMTWIEYATFRLLLFGMAVIPESLLYPLMRSIFQGVFWVDSRHRERAIRHLLHAGIVETRSEAVTLARAHFAHLANVLCDVGTSYRHITPDKINDLIRIVGEPDLVAKLTARDSEGRYPQVIIATAHFGNWEVAGNMYAWLSGRPLLSVMRPLDNPMIGDYIYSQRQSAEHTIVSKAGALKRLLQAAKQGKSICMVVDQHAGKGEGVEATLFGKPVSMHSSLAKIHLRTGLPILVGACRRLDNRHHYVFDGVALIEYLETGDSEADIKAVSQLYMDALEKMIRIDPAQWLWPHRRFLDLRRLDWAEKRQPNELKERK